MRRGLFDDAIPRGRGVDGYIPKDAVERAETYQRYSGAAARWPILLTRCGQPSGRQRTIVRD